MADHMDLRIRISADGTAAITGINRVDASLDQLDASGRQAGAGVDQLTNSLLQLTLGEAVISAISAKMGEVAKMADDWNNLQARIRLVTGSAEEASAALDGVRRVAIATRSDVGETGDLYTTLARALKSLGDETASAIDLTETIAQALALSGRSASENNSAITQLSQALASGVLRGDEFNSMMENGPRLMQALADALGTTTGELRAMAEAGTLSADILVSALTDQAGVIAAEFATLPLTIGGAMTNVGTAIKGLVGDFDDTSAASTRVAEAIQAVADHLDEVATVAAGAGLAAVAAGAGKAATAMSGLAAATVLARNARAEQALAERTALAVEADAAALNARLSVSYLERAAAANVLAQAELRAAQSTVLAAQAQAATATGFQRLAATEALIAALNQQVIAEERAAIATQAYTAAQLSAASAAGAAATAQTAASATAGLWARAAAGLGGALVLLKSPMNALISAAVAIIGYQVGAHLRDWGLNALYAAEEGTLAANAFDLLATAAETAARHLQEIDEKTAETLKAIAKETGLAFNDMEDFANAVDKGAVIWDAANQSWRQGAVSLDIARAAVSKLDAALQTQGQALDAVAKRETESLKLDAQRRDLTISLVQGLGDEASAITLVSAARAADVVASERLLDLSKAALANTEARLANMIAEAQAGEGLTEAKQAEINSLTEEVEKKRQAVAASQLATETARAEQVQAQLAADTYGDQSAQLATLTREREDAAAVVARLDASHQAAAQASRDLVAAEAQLEAIAKSYTTALAAQAAGNQDLSASVAELGPQHQAAKEAVDALRAVIEAGTVADQQAAQAKLALAMATAKAADAARDLVARKELEAAAAERVTQAMGEEGALRVTHLRNLAREADARGEVVAASQYTQQAIQAEIEVLSRLIAAKDREIETARATLEAKQKEADLDEQLSLQEEEALARAQALVEAKEREKAAIEETRRAKEEEAAATERNAQAHHDAADAATGSTKGLDDLGGAMDEASTATEKNRSVTLSWAQMMRNAGVDVQALGDYAQVAEEAFKAMFITLQDGRWLDGFAYGKIARGAAVAAEAAAAHARAVDELAERMQDLNSAYQAGEIGLSQYIGRLQAAASGTARLGDEDLADLRAAIADAKQQMADFANSAQDGLRSLQIEWANLNNNRAEAQTLEYQRDRIALEQQIVEAQRDGNAAAIAALQAQLALLAKIHQKKLADLKNEQAAALNGTEAGVTWEPTPTSTNRAAGLSGSRATTAGTGGGGMSAPVGGAGTTVNINVSGMFDAGDRAAMTNLTRKIKPYFDDMARRGA